MKYAVLCRFKPAEHSKWQMGLALSEDDNCSQVLAILNTEGLRCLNVWSYQTLPEYGCLPLHFPK